MLLLANGDELIMVKAANDKYILRQVSILYDMLAESVDELNEVFSTEVHNLLCKISFQFNDRFFR